MLSEKPWKPQAVMMLLLGIFACLSFGALLLNVVIPKGELAAPQWKFINFMVSTVALHGGALVMIAFFLREHQVGWKEAFGFNAPGLPRGMMLAVITVLLVTPLAWTLGKISALVMEQVLVTPEVQSTVQTLQSSVDRSEQYYFAFVAILIAPVVEEILFRGIVYPSLKQSGRPQLALWVTSLAFAAIHGNAMSFVSLAVLGMVLIALYEKTNNLLVPIVTHSLFNLINFLFVLNPHWTEALT
ncbi:MAG: type II CAAX endopeptidase family protein [Verrucomicrobiota bacterium]